ncbi:unnamed protein product [Effrenium voratum]|uniref:START domain-containing protein n=1 Tax=Effrenium voratum TaxID=2562239 RepID=A0AA36JFZ4_9DINO|nr:unnamed protein product [Effrenium voratum]
MSWCFAGLFAPSQVKKPRSYGKTQSDGSGSPSWVTLPLPVSQKVLKLWFPISSCQQGTRLVLFCHCGSFDLLSLEHSGCTRRDLLSFCEEKLAELTVKEETKISLVVDLLHVSLQQLNSHWWKILAPRVLDMVEDRFPQLDELIFVRANRLSSLAAERVIVSTRLRASVLSGDEIAAEAALQSRGLGFVSDCFFRDPSISAVEFAQKRREQLRRVRRWRRWITGLLVAILVLLLGQILGVLPVRGADFDWAGLWQVVRDWEMLHHVVVSLLPQLLLLGFLLWRPKGEADTAQMLVLLIGSPLAWASAYAGNAPAPLAAAAPALVTALLGLAVIPWKEPKATATDAARRKGAWWPELVHGAYGEPRFAVPEESVTRMIPPIEGDGRRLLTRLLEFSSACAQVPPGRKQKVGDMLIQRIVSQENRAVWSASVGSDPVMFVASEVIISTSEPLEAVLWAIYSAEERMQWDGAAFAAYKVLGQQVQASSESLCDFLYCRVPLVPGVKDRDMVQERFLLKLPSNAGYAIAIQSCSPGQCSALRLDPVPSVVRARTILSGYILRPNPGGGVVLTGVSQTDLGGYVPQWVQGLVKKAGKRMPVQWAQRLEDYCNSKASAGTR